MNQKSDMFKYKFNSSKNKLYTFNKKDVKDNIVIIESVLLNFKNALNDYIQNINTLYESIDDDGFDLSYDSFKKDIKKLIKEFEINSNKLLSNNAAAINLKIINNNNKIISIRQTTKYSNYELDNNPTMIEASNNNLNYLHFSNTDDNIIKVIIGNNNSSFEINVGDVILVKKTSNYNGFFKCKEVIQKYNQNYIDGIYTFYAEGLTNIHNETFSQSIQIIIYNSPIEEVTVGYNTTTTRPYILSGDPTQTFNAASTNVSSLTLSCETDGEVTITASGGTLLDSTNFAVNNIVKIDGSLNSNYNKYFIVKTVGNNTTCILYGGSETLYKANSLQSETTTSNNPFVTISNWLSANTIDISNTQNIAISKRRNRLFNIGTSILTNDLTSSISQFIISELNGIMTITLTNGLFDSTTTFGDIIELQNTTNFNGYFMVSESLTADSSTLKCYSGSIENLYADETHTSPLLYSKKYSDNQVPISIDTSSYKQYELGTAAITITADDEADSFLQFQNNIKEEIKLTIGKNCNSPNISSKSFIEIQNTINYNGLWSIKNINSIHSSSTHGVYILDAPDLKSNKLEKHYFDASLNIYSSNKEYSILDYNNVFICGSNPFIIKLNEHNKHIAFYIPGFTLYKDETNILELLFTDNISRIDIDDGKDKVIKYRLSGKNFIPNNISELKKIYKQIINSENDLDKINPNTDINDLIKNLNVITRSISSIKSASYL